VRTTLSKGILTLSDILPRERAQRFLEIYLTGDHFFHNQYDTDLLHKLICDIDKYSRNEIQVDELRRLLIVDKQIPNEIADKISSSIYEGLELLDKRRKYY